MVTKLGKDNSYMLFGASGMMEQNERVHIGKGTKIFAYGYAMNLQYFVVYDNEMNAVEIGSPDEVQTVEDLPDRYFSARHHLDETTRPISKKFGIGFYYDDSGELVGEDVITKSLERAEKIERLEKDAKEHKEKEDAETEKRLLSEYSYLERCGRFDHKACGKNIRTELKRAFPAVKFSVRYESFSGGDSYDVTWTDGPTTQQVDIIVKKYADMHPDAYSMGDYWDCVPSIFNNLFGSVGYVMTQRALSECAINKAMEENAGFDRGAARDLLWKTDLSPVVEKMEERKTVISGKYDIIDYSAKSFAVIGDTKAIKDDLKRIGGCFNSRLSCGAGWIFSNKKREEVKKLLNVK